MRIKSSMRMSRAIARMVPSDWDKEREGERERHRSNSVSTDLHVPPQCKG
jgi:hypothetical protein